MKHKFKRLRYKVKSSSIKHHGKPDKGRTHIDSETQLNCWKSIVLSIIGTHHLLQEPMIPCQDSSLTACIPRPYLIVADGAGSAALSHIASLELVRHMSHFIQSIDDINAMVLDDLTQMSSNQVSIFGSRLIRHAIGTIQYLTQKYKKEFSSFYSTLSIVIIGKQKLFWFKIGDGLIILERDQKFEVLGTKQKGDFFNQTVFVNPGITIDKVDYGLEPIISLNAIVIASDGVAERLVSHDYSQVAPSLLKMINDYRSSVLTRQKLYEFLNDPFIWQKTSGDDKTLGLIVRNEL